MATHELHFEDGVLEFNQDVEWITSDLPEPDPNWRGTDSNGHEHHAVEESDRVVYPTLTLVAGEPYWCQDCQDEHTDTWWECSVCGEKVTPGTRASTPKPVTRGQQYYWDGVPISTERANEIMQRQYRAEIEARRLTARPPIGRRVHLASDPRTAVTVVPPAEGEPDGAVTVMHDGTGRMETLPLGELLRARR
ncbi:hypothetical protein ACF07M_30220 [Streptomyces globisporus]|uniref:hypothetical protein n=1 Tax=Streptomyces globisporus TaxID=1908 RepID=UPI0036F82953